MRTAGATKPPRICHIVNVIADLDSAAYCATASMATTT